MTEDKKAIYKAISDVSRKVGTVGKGAFNQHGAYRYVSIDKYYETVGVAAAEAGLSWVLREDGFNIRTDIGKSGMLHITYAVDVMHDSGVFESDFSRISIIHPIQGAQTVGSAMSYGDKVFMRQVFHIATGEEDADSTNPSDLDIPAKAPPSIDLDPPKPAPSKAKQPPKAEGKPPKIEQIPGEEGDWDTVIEVFRKFIPTCESSAGLKAFWLENTAAINALKEGHPTAYEEVKNMFTQRKNEVEK